jgi:hypothetical protein
MAAIFPVTAGAVKVKVACPVVALAWGAGIEAVKAVGAADGIKSD